MHTIDQIKANVHYNPETGVFTRISTGNEIFTVARDGYCRVMIDRINYIAHRLAWFYMTTQWPVNQIDHKDRVRTNNVWSNLREADHYENAQNKNINVNNTSGYRGVTWHKREKKWMARIGVGGQTIQLGYFRTPEEAASAYEQAKAELHTFQPVIE